MSGASPATVAALRARLMDGREHLVETELAALRDRVAAVEDDGAFLFITGARGRVVYLSAYGGGLMGCRIDGEPWPVTP